MRKYKPVQLPLKAVPDGLAGELAVCPNCQESTGGVIGRLGLRLVFRCGRCRVRFHRASASAGMI